MAKDKKERILKNNFSFDGNQNEYGFKLKKKPRPWWLLLLLLPLLLLIPLKKDITVMTKVDGNPEPFVDVSMKYTGRYLLWDWHFLVDRPFDTIQQTDADGVTVFKDLGYSVYSYIFRCKEPITFMAGGECFEDVEASYRFHKVRKVTLDMDPRTADVRLKVVDSELGFEIPGSLVEVEFDGRGGREMVTDTTDAAGCVVIKGARLCGGFGSIKASADGYADTLLVERTVEELLKEAGGYPIPLRPLKDRFTFFVKNKYTKQPVPDALAEVTLTLNGNIGSVGKSRTNVDGLGQGFFDDARVLAKVDIKASKRPHYKDGRFVSPTGKELMVREFKALPDSLRVVWLEPEPYSVDFRNVDTLTGQPIPGVRNEILVEGIDGTTRRSVETSNRNGYFPVKAVAGDKVTIVSTLDPYYHPKTTVVGKFEKGGIIYMRPVQVNLKFRTVEEDQGVITGILPDCDLVVTVDGKRVDPTNSGNGEFEVPNLLLTSKISIEASKSGYGSNNTKVNNRSVEYLWKADQSERDIPLRKYLKLTFRTVEVVDGTVTGILPDCDLVVTVDGKRVNPTNSGTGEFTLEDVKPNSRISIEASKPGYEGNRTKVNNRTAEELMNASQDERDIPLVIPGCDAGTVYSSEAMGEGSAQYRVGKGPCSFLFKYDTRTQPDSFRIYIGTINDVKSGRAKLIKQILNERSHGWKETRINLSAGEGPYITVVANFEEAGSVFDYIVECPE